MKARLAKFLAGVFLIVAAQGAVCEDRQDRAGELEGLQMQQTPEAIALMDVVLAFLREYKDQFAPLFVPSEAKTRMAWDLLGRLLPLLRSRLPADEMEKMEGDFRAAYAKDEEILHNYEAMERLRGQIQRETDASTLESLRAELAERISLMKELRQEAMNMERRSQILQMFDEMARKNPLVEALNDLYEAAVISPFRDYA